MMSGSFQPNFPDGMRDYVSSAKIEGDVSLIRTLLNSDFQMTKIKENPKRLIFRLESETWEESVFFKFFRHVSLWGFLFHNPPKIEFENVSCWARVGIPMIQIPLWGRYKNTAFTISPSVPHAMQGLEYGMKNALRNQKKAMFFLTKLEELLRLLLQKKCFHPDFHLGNILVNAENSDLFLADPLGMRKVCFLSDKYRLAMVVPWRELSLVLPQSVIENSIVHSTLASNTLEARRLLLASQTLFQRVRQQRSEHIHQQIMRGNSKYTRDFERNGVSYSFAHNFWFGFPEKLEIEPNWKKYDFPDMKSSEKIWIDSMVVRDLSNPQPVLRVVYPDGKSSLYMTDYRSYCL